MHWNRSNTISRKDVSETCRKLFRDHPRAEIYQRRQVLTACRGPPLPTPIKTTPTGNKGKFSLALLRDNGG